ncbi:MAG: DUF1491 family protein [Sphingomonadales bacterium]|nr:DUF1491 family protein [Sphingomonadales bacterium]MDE2568280.1 DUF1491 family protein [Sphingomonadales bacterium]
MTARLPAHVEVTGWIRAAEAAGGFGMVVKKGERDAGTLLIVCVQRDGTSVLYERMPQLDGTRAWTETRVQSAENKQEFEDYLARRASQDDDLWIVELTVDDPKRLVLES